MVQFTSQKCKMACNYYVSCQVFTLTNYSWQILFLYFRALLSGKCKRVIVVYYTFGNEDDFRSFNWTAACLFMSYDAISGDDGLKKLHVTIVSRRIMQV